MCAICIQFDNNQDVAEFKEMLAAARKEVGSVDPVHLSDLEESLRWYEEEII